MLEPLNLNLGPQTKPGLVGLRPSPLRFWGFFRVQGSGLGFTVSFMEE